MTSPDGKYRIVVGQEWEYREDMALAIVAAIDPVACRTADYVNHHDGTTGS